MADDQKKCCEFFSSLTYTNILLTILVIMLVAGVFCKHMFMSNKRMMGGKGMMMGSMGGSKCPVTTPQEPEAK